MKGCRKGFTLIQILFVILVSAILAMFFVPLLLGVPSREAFEEQSKLVEESRIARTGYEKGAKLLLETWPMYATDTGWYQLAISVGYADKDPRKTDWSGSWRSTLHFRDWSDIQSSALPPEKTVWAWEVLHYKTIDGLWKELSDTHTPFMCRTTRYAEEYQGGISYVFQRATLVLFADGSTRICELKDLERLGLVSKKTEPFVWPDGMRHGASDAISYEKWREELSRFPRRGKLRDGEWELVAPLTPAMIKGAGDVSP